jgi:uncharacterized repeat protein (TIGR03803 family)
VIYAFMPTGNDGFQPAGPLALDSAGAVYGTTLGGGSSGVGTVFQLTPPAAQGGGWTETLLYSLASSGSDGYFPVAGVVFDSTGALNGVTETGGDPSYDCGTAFRLTPPPTPGGAWTFSLLHSFQGASDGAAPQAGLSSYGPNIYGTTSQGGGTGCLRFGMQGCGTLFEITP